MKNIEKAHDKYTKLLAGTKYCFDAAMYVRNGVPGIVKRVYMDRSEQAYYYDKVTVYNWFGFHYYFKQVANDEYTIIFACTYNKYNRFYEDPIIQEIFKVDTKECLKRKDSKSLVKFAKADLGSTYCANQVRSHIEAFKYFPQELVNRLITALEQESKN